MIGHRISARIHILIILFTTALVFETKAQLSYSSYDYDPYSFLKDDTLSLESLPSNKSEKRQKWENIRSNNIVKFSLPGIPLIIGGILVRTEDKKFRDLRNAQVPMFRNQYDDYMQYTPMLTMYALKVAGVDSHYAWPRMITSNAFSALIMAGVVNTIKHTVKEQRPDGSNYHSFPSGHSATAFMGATMLHYEYGLTRSPWYSVAGYTLATATGISRIVNNKHWLSDVMVGAGIGIMSAEVGYFLAGLIFKDKYIERGVASDKDFNYARNPSFIGMNIALGFSHDKYDISDNIQITTLSGSKVSFEGAWFFKRNWGVGGKLSASYLPLSLSKAVPDVIYNGNTYHVTNAESKPVNIICLNAGPYYSYPITDRLLFNLKAAPTVYFSSSNTVYLYTTKNGGNDVTKHTILDTKGHIKIGGNAGATIKYVIKPKMALKIFSEYDVMPSKPKYTINENVENPIGDDGRRLFMKVCSVGVGMDVMLW